MNDVLISFSRGASGSDSKWILQILNDAGFTALLLERESQDEQGFLRRLKEEFHRSAVFIPLIDSVRIKAGDLVDIEVSAALRIGIPIIPIYVGEADPSVFENASVHHGIRSFPSIEIRGDAPRYAYAEKILKFVYGWVGLGFQTRRNIEEQLRQFEFRSESIPRSSLYFKPLRLADTSRLEVRLEALEAAREDEKAQVERLMEQFRQIGYSSPKPSFHKGLLFGSLVSLCMAISLFAGYLARGVLLVSPELLILVAAALMAMKFALHGYTTSTGDR